jgi:hypothetical protein
MFLKRPLAGRPARIPLCQRSCRLDRAVPRDIAGLIPSIGERIAPDKAKHLGHVRILSPPRTRAGSLVETSRKSRGCGVTVVTMRKRSPVENIIGSRADRRSGGAEMSAHYVTVETKLYCHGQYQTVMLGDVTIGPDLLYPALTALVGKMTRLVMSHPFAQPSSACHGGRQCNPRQRRTGSPVMTPVPWSACGRERRRMRRVLVGCTTGKARHSA